MGKCKKCGSHRLLSISAKCSDMCSCRWADKKGKSHEHDGYVPDIIGTYGDYVELEFCLECGQEQGEYPRPDPTWSD